MFNKYAIVTGRGTPGMHESHFRLPSGIRSFLSVFKARRFLLGFILFPAAAAALAQSSGADIHSVDFKNFSYPWLDPHGWPNQMRWLDLTLKSKIDLVNGKWDQRSPEEMTDSYPFVGLSLEDVRFAKFSPDSAECAMVILRYDSGGTQNHRWVYIYGLSNGAPVLMGLFHSGDRAYSGLYRVYEKDHLLNVELFDPQFRDGDCCSNGYVNYQYRWNGAEFEAVGKPRSEFVNAPKQRSTSIFRLPIGRK